MEGGRQIRNIAKKRSVSGETPGGQVLFELSCENTGLEALHFHREVKQFKVGLLFALSKLSKQSIFQAVKRVLGLYASTVSAKESTST
jgi:hypothetical protein